MREDVSNKGKIKQMKEIQSECVKSIVLLLFKHSSGGVHRFEISKRNTVQRNKKTTLLLNYDDDTVKHRPQALQDGIPVRRLHVVLVEQELAQFGGALLHLAQGGDLLGQLALSLVLFIQVLAGQVVDQLLKKGEIRVNQKYMNVKRQLKLTW